MTRKRGTYIGGSTIIIPDKRPHDVRLAEASQHHRRKVERDQQKHDEEIRAWRKYVEKVLQEDSGRKGSSAKPRAQKKYHAPNAKNRNHKRY